MDHSNSDAIALIVPGIAPRNPAKNATRSLINFYKGNTTLFFRLNYLRRLLELEFMTSYELSTCDAAGRLVEINTIKKLIQS